MRKALLAVITFATIMACASCAPDETEPEALEKFEVILEAAPIEALTLESKPATGGDKTDTADDEPPPVSDGARFAIEYMEHNGQLRSNGEPHIVLNISEDNTVVYLEADEVISKLEFGSGIINLGFPICPWCREIVPHLIELAEQENVPLYYMNIQSIRDVLELDESGEIITTTEGTPEYHRMVEILYDWLWEYAGLNDPEIKRIYVPTTIFVRDGDILYVHIATLRENYEGGYRPLDDQQVERVTSYLTAAMIQIFTDDNVVEDDCDDCP